MSSNRQDPYLEMLQKVRELGGTSRFYEQYDSYSPPKVQGKSITSFWQDDSRKVADKNCWQIGERKMLEEFLAGGLWSKELLLGPMRKDKLLLLCG